MSDHEFMAIESLLLQIVAVLTMIGMTVTDRQKNWVTWSAFLGLAAVAWARFAFLQVTALIMLLA